MKYIVFTFFIGFCTSGAAQVAQEKQPHWTDYSDTLNNKRLIGVSSGAFALTAGSLVLLNELWYKGYPRTSLHSFNDWGEWEGVDKMGHGFTSYYLGTIGFNALRWSGVKEGKALAFGATWGLIYLTGMELLDGHSAHWGFSWGDMTANTLGCGLFIGQQLLWHQQRVVPKFSFHTTQYPQYRPEIMGTTLAQQVIKDYNGQTYWLSTNIHSFLNKGSKFPKWLSVSVGYGATGMIGGHGNPVQDSEGNAYPHFDRYSQWYFSLDVDLHRIKTKSKFLNGVLTTLGWIKFPFPALEFNKNGVLFHPLYF